MYKTDFKHTSPDIRYISIIGLDFIKSSCKFCQRTFVICSVKPGSFQLQDKLSGTTGQFPWYEKESFSNSLDHFLSFFLIQHFFLEKIHQVIAQHQKLKAGVIPGIVVRDNFIQSKAIYALLDKIFTCLRATHRQAERVSSISPRKMVWQMIW